MQAGWMRLRLSLAPLISTFTPRVGFSPVHLVRDSSSFAKSRPGVLKNRLPRDGNPEPSRPAVPTHLRVNRTSYSRKHIWSRRPRHGVRPSRPAAHLQPKRTSLLPNSSRNIAPVGSTIERAHSRHALHDNLLRLLSSSRTSHLPILLDYHELHPGVRSVRSYNLLISLAIRHVAYGTVQSLLWAMDADKIPGNSETQKLKTRWLIRSGLWEHAWLQVTASYPDSLPLPLWLEFFHGTKAGALAMGPIVTHGVKGPLTRFQTLMQRPPAFKPFQSKSSVRAIRIVARAMLDLNKPQSALSIATRYFNGLPRDVGVTWAEQCVAIVDGLIAFEARKKRGLPGFYTARRKLNSLLAIHPSFRPTAKTLYLLLSTLRQAKQCGTLSWHTLTKFKTRWGPQVEDRRVRRRVASYAIIERRLDIVNKVFDAERRSRLLEAGTMEQPQPQLQLAPKLLHEMFPRHGYEARLWKLLKGRAWKLELKLRAQKEKAGDGDSII